MPVRISRIGWIVIIVIVVAAALALERWKSSNAVKPVPMATVVRQDIYSGIVTNGKAEPVEFREVRPAVEGEISELPVHEGEEVHPGARLATISQPQIASEIESARAALNDAEESLRILKQGGSIRDVTELKSQLDQARRERDEAARIVAQNQHLLEKGAIARMELDESRQRLGKAESDLALTGQKLDRRYDPEQMANAEAAVGARRAALDAILARQRSSVVAAAINGTVYSLAVRQGDYVKAGDLLMRVGDFSKIRVRVYVDEPDLGRVKIGQTVVVRWDGLPGREWRGAVDRLASEIKDVGTRKVGEVWCLLDNPARELLPNMNLDVEIVTEERKNVLTVPREAVFGSGPSRSVFVVDDGILKSQPVKTGITNVTRIEVRDGLSDSEQVALASETPLKAGLHVTNLMQ